MKKYNFLIVGVTISVFLLIGMSLFNFQFVNNLPKEIKTESKLLITWINNFIGLAFFVNVGYFSFKFLKVYNEVKESEEENK